jgi:hypothetical protein
MARVHGYNPANYLSYSGIVRGVAPLSYAACVNLWDSGNISAVFEEDPGQKIVYLQGMVGKGALWQLLAASPGAMIDVTEYVDDIPLDRWFSMSGSMPSANSGLLAIDGIRVGTPTIAGSFTAITSGVTKIPDCSCRLAEAGIWNISKTVDDDVATGQGYCNLLVRPCGLLSYWPLGGAYGNQDKDRVGHAHMTPVGSPTWTNNHPKTIYPCECMCC